LNEEVRMTAAMNQDDFQTAWPNLEPAFQEAMELAWRSLVGGTIGVGSAITDPDGKIIARGRNRVYDQPGGDGILQGNRLAHAEMNALAEVETDFSLADCTLWSTQQPCVLCTSASVMSFVGTVRFLAADPVFDGIDRLPELNDWLDRYWPSFEGPTSDDRWAIAAMLLQLYAAASKNPTGEVMEANHRVEPETATLIEQIVQDRVWNEGAGFLPSASAALSAVWASILAAATARQTRRLSETVSE
jgi:tRNA(Arg) A34 adenosine deaminase TadA